MSNQNSILSEQHVELSTKMDFVIQELGELKTVINIRVDRTNTKVDKLEKGLARVQGGIMALWGVVLILATLAGGIILKVFNGIQR